MQLLEILSCPGTDLAQLYIDPSDPTRCLSFAQTRTLVRRLVSGFKSIGLSRGDCVCVMSFNDVRAKTILLVIAEILTVC